VAVLHHTCSLPGLPTVTGRPTPRLRLLILVAGPLILHRVQQLALLGPTGGLRRAQVRAARRKSRDDSLHKRAVLGDRDFQVVVVVARTARIESDLQNAAGPIGIAQRPRYDEKK
jgi:hypothetical protein